LNKNKQEKELLLEQYNNFIKLKQNHKNEEKINQNQNPDQNVTVI